MTRPRDLRAFVAEYGARYPEDTIRISRPISAKWECTEIARKFHREGKSPLVTFEKVVTTQGKVSDFPCVINVLADRRKLAFAIGSSLNDIGLEWMKRSDARQRPVVVPAGEAPVKERIFTGDAIDLLSLPAFHYHEMDPGPYLTAGMLTTRDVEGRAYNSAFQRGFIAGPREIRCFIGPSTHNFQNMQGYHTEGRPMPVVFWLGHHPAVLMGASTHTAYLADHYEMAGGVSGAPLRLVPSETFGHDFLVPADAEFVIEGLIAPNVVKPEGPFGEFVRYYGPQRHSPVLEVTAMTCRTGGLWDSFMVGLVNAYGGVQEEASLLVAAKRVVPAIQRIHVPVSGAGRFHVYVQIRKTNDGQPKAAIMAILAASPYAKHVIVVDEDVDVYDEASVLWAVATRSQWDRDLILIPGCQGYRLDPTTSVNGLSAKAGIDATKPAPPRRFPARLSVPKEVEETIRLEDYIERSALNNVPPSASK